ncbi:hypothetical protein [Allokutzneria oryzae]|uniref:Uncharacterized protein n=1 Tax=Allokutzneria oryzae TaxID=1378989 RepID=A0ABV5ZYT2_9PSEU
MKVLVRDGTVRAVGAECSGTGAYAALHRSAKFRVRAVGGKRLAEGALPEGRAVAALDEDIGVPRVPTFCEMTFKVALPAAEYYELVVDGAEEPIRLRREHRQGPAAGVVP